MSNTGIIKISANVNAKYETQICGKDKHSCVMTAWGKTVHAYGKTQKDAIVAAGQKIRIVCK